MSLNMFNAKYIIQAHLNRADAQDGAPCVQEGFAKNRRDARVLMQELSEEGLYYAAIYDQEGEVIDETADVE